MEERNVYCGLYSVTKLLDKSVRLYFQTMIIEGAMVDRSKTFRFIINVITTKLR